MRRCPLPGARERGAAAVIFAIVLLVIGGFLALGLNVGHFMSVRNQLQNAADAGALAGARSLDGTADGIVAARLAAEQFAERHATDRLPVELDPNLANDPAGDIVFGDWDFSQPKESAFHPITDPFANPGQVNAILVRYGREPVRGNALDVYFAAFLGQSTASVTAEAVGVGGGPCSDCGIPFVFADCLILKEDGSVDCGKELVFSSSLTDNLGFTNLSPDSSVNPNIVVERLNGNCSGVDVGGSIGVANGNDFTPAVLQALQAYIDRNGATVTAPVVSPATCPTPQFNQMQPVAGFATFTILELSGPPNKMIRVRLDCTTDPSETEGGCKYFGTPGQSRLGR